MYSYHRAKIHETLKQLQLQVDDMNEALARAEEKIDEFNSQEEIADRDAYIDTIFRNSIAVLTEDEAVLEEEFKDSHYNSCRNDGHWVYDIVQTGLGAIVEIKCPTCGRRLNLSESKDLY